MSDDFKIGDLVQVIVEKDFAYLLNEIGTIYYTDHNADHIEVRFGKYKMIIGFRKSQLKKLDAKLKAFI